MLKFFPVMAIKSIPVRSAAGSYSVLYGGGLIARAAQEIEALGEHTGLFLLTLAARGAALAGKARVPAFAAPVGAPRSSSMTGSAPNIWPRWKSFAANWFARVPTGAPCSSPSAAASSATSRVRRRQLPARSAAGACATTLVAQVDSAIGGKTGVNLPEGKNLVGAFYPPRLVLADPATLATLPPREFRSGLYEVVKYGVIGDPRLFSFLEKNIERLRSVRTAALDFVIPRCIRAKADVVGRDERESGLREILNFGHTFAHAFETATAYRRYLHGEAVGWGMIAAARLGAANRHVAGSARRAHRDAGPARRTAAAAATEAKPPAQSGANHGLGQEDPWREAAIRFAGSDRPCGDGRRHLPIGSWCARVLASLAVNGYRRR